MWADLLLCVSTLYYITLSRATYNKMHSQGSVLKTLEVSSVPSARSGHLDKNWNPVE